MIQAMMNPMMMNLTTKEKDFNKSSRRCRCHRWKFFREISSMVGFLRNKTIFKKLADGKIDIIIGTHKLLQSDIQFHNIGLIIIDEEHRFGVKQKEKLKSIRTNVDLLTLTATPIPRTLNMALSGVRDLSIIATPPAKRLSVKTFLYEYNKVIIEEAIRREILRGGQTYYLHNDLSVISYMMLEQ